MTGLLPPEAALRRLQAICRELDLSVGQATLNDQGFSLTIDHARYPILARHTAGTRFVSLMVTLKPEAESALSMVDRLAGCAEICRQLGCQFFPQAVGTGIELEVGLPLYISSIQYYAVEEMLFNLEFALDQIQAYVEDRRGNP